MSWAWVRGTAGAVGGTGGGRVVAGAAGGAAVAVRAAGTPGWFPAGPRRDGRRWPAAGPVPGGCPPWRRVSLALPSTPRDRKPAAPCRPVETQAGHLAEVSISVPVGEQSLDGGLPAAAGDQQPRVALQQRPDLAWYRRASRGVRVRPPSPDQVPGARPAVWPGSRCGAAVAVRAATWPERRARRGLPSLVSGGRPDGAAPRPCRSTRISASLAAALRASRTSQPSTRTMNK